MQNTSERIDFIVDYLSSYESKIQLLNNCGLFDAAKLFELFAIEVGSMYFEQRLSNLNVDKYTYPCVDLVSADKQLYVQVSTVQDIPAKIKKTLESIRDSKRADIKALTKVVFFVLSNASTSKVKDYAEETSIGDIQFIKANDLITTQDILQKATTDLGFQIALYDLLKKETDSIRDNSSKLKDAIENSKVGLGKIDCKIKGEYEIDRSEFIAKVKGSVSKNISIQGGAGSGKSVVCKKLVEGEPTVLYARAESFLEKTDINDIWGFNVRQTLEYMGDKPIVFFIDSLEFIADIRTRLDLLSILYECTKEYPKAKIVTSCRSSDKYAFIKIESDYAVYSDEVPELTMVEQLAIAKKYPIIKKMSDINSYTELLKSPFYINLIVSEVTDIDNIADENQLRQHIWQNVICSRKDGLKIIANDNKTREVVEDIVFTRATSLSVDADITKHDTGIIDQLISAEIIVGSGKAARLKYDIFEDICFEQYFDREFDACKAKYGDFFSKIELLGRCVYRRYQIWISNKLLAKDNREKFLHELIFSDSMPSSWRKQTIIGLVKSRFCVKFFNEYGQKIIENGIIKDFLNIVNLYAFEIRSDFSAKQISYIQLNPCGKGRECLIDIITENKLYEKSIISLSDLEKLCSDYSKVKDLDKATAEKSCAILQYMISSNFADADVKKYYRLYETVNRLLEPIYRMAEYAKDWIKAFWNNMIISYKSDENRGDERLASEIIKDALTFKHTNLAKQLPKELCEIAEMYWTYSSSKKKKHDGFGIYNRRGDYHSEWKFGLSEKADSYDSGHYGKDPILLNFFYMLFRHNFWIGLKWAINFINCAALEYRKNCKDRCFEYEIKFVETNTLKKYIGAPEWWLATEGGIRFSSVLGDLLFCLQEVLMDTFSQWDASDLTAKIADDIKRYIFDRSNNIAFLSIIANIGIKHQKKLPGHALDLASNLDIVSLDISSVVSSMATSNKKSFSDTLQNHVIYSQMYGTKEVKEKCHAIIDYLYSITDSEKDAGEHLQIQKMDWRYIEVERVDDTTVAVSAKITGKAKDVVEAHRKSQEPETNLKAKIDVAEQKLKDQGLSVADCICIIDTIMAERKKLSINSLYDYKLILFIDFALKNKDLPKKSREQFCVILLEWMEDILANGGLKFMFDKSNALLLFQQLDSSISGKIKNRIKLAMLQSIIDRSSNGLIKEVARYAKLYLGTNRALAQAMFNTVIGLAEDEMSHQKFNAEYIQNNREDEEFSFTPNMQPKLRGVDIWVKEAAERNEAVEGYKSQKQEITDKFLLEEESLALGDFDVQNFDIGLLCYAVNCGLDLSNKDFANIVKKIVVCMIDIWHKDNRHSAHEILGTYALYEIMDFLQRELLGCGEIAKTVLDVLFADIDFQKFTSETTKFYLDVFGGILSEYFDSHSDKAKRTNCENIIRLLEEKVLGVSEDKVKVELYKSLIFSLTTYGGAGDWSKCPSGYSYQDKQFLNGVFGKYGGFHLKEMLDAVFKLHYKKLLPEILLSIKEAFKFALKAGTDKNRIEAFADTIREKKPIVLAIITRAFLDCGKLIKQDDELTKAFEEVLEMLVAINNEEAAVILDEFRIH